MKKYFELFKLMWNDERGKALIKLGFYIIFMFFVIMYVRSIHFKSEVKRNELTVLEKFSSKIVGTEVVTVNDNIYNLTFGDTIKMSDKDNEYNISNNVVTMLANNEIIPFEVYFWNITPKLIGNLVKDKNTYYVTRYDDGSRDEAYKVPLQEFISSFEGQYLDIEFLDQIAKEEIIIVIHQDSEKIENVSLNLSSYYKIISGLDNEYELKIEY